MNNKEKQETYSPVGNIVFLLRELWEADKVLVIYTMFKALTESIYYVFSYVWLTKYIYRCIELRTPFNEFTFSCLCSTILLYIL